MSDYDYDPRDDSVKCSNCLNDFEDHEVIQRSCVRGRRQYICFACVSEVEVPEQAQAVSA